MRLTLALSLALLLLGPLARAEPIEAHNAWKKMCRQLSLEFKERLPVPYHPYSHKEAVKCSDPMYRFEWAVEPSNLHVIFVNLFYHDRFSVQERALELLERYNCSKDGTCGEVAKLFREHLKAAGMTHKLEWTRKFFDRARAIQRRAEAD